MTTMIWFLFGIVGAYYTAKFIPEKEYTHEIILLAVFGPFTFISAIFLAFFGKTK